MPSRPELYKPDGQLDWDAIRADYRSRCSPLELEISNMTVAEIFARRGWNKSGGDKKSRTEKLPLLSASDVPDMTRISIVIDYNDRISIRDMAEKYNLNPGTVKKILQGAGAYDASRGDTR